MGTRSVIAVAYQGEWKIAQYSQWDGGLDGQGLGVLNFIKGEGNVESLKTKLPKVRFLDGVNRDRDFFEKFNDKSTRTKEMSLWYDQFINRDIGSDILKNITEADFEELLLVNNLDFASNGIGCEYVYLIDLDNERFECHYGLVYGIYSEGYLQNINRSIYGKVYKFSELPSEEEFVKTE